MTYFLTSNECQLDAIAMVLRIGLGLFLTTLSGF